MLLKSGHVESICKSSSIDIFFTLFFRQHPPQNSARKVCMMLSWPRVPRSFHLSSHSQSETLRGIKSIRQFLLVKVRIVSSLVIVFFIKNPLEHKNFPLCHRIVLKYLRVFSECYSSFQIFLSKCSFLTESIPSFVFTIPFKSRFKHLLSFFVSLFIFICVSRWGMSHRWAFVHSWLLLVKKLRIRMLHLQRMVFLSFFISSLLQSPSSCIATSNIKSILRLTALTNSPLLL